MTEEETQRRHYNEYAEAHDAIRSFDGVLAYRDRFLIPAILGGEDLAGKRVLEAMCGSGFITDYLLEQGATVTAFDISDRQIELFAEKYPAVECHRVSIFDDPFPAAQFDVVVVAAGFHHLHPRVEDSFRLCVGWLKPGGLLCFYEPHAHSFPDRARRLWYRFDPIFEEGEGAVDIDRELSRLGTSVVEESRCYLGGPAFFTVVNGNVLRLPVGFMDRIAPTMLWLESLHFRVFRRSRLATPLAACRWRKR
jgi:SAM-dependent methyltransferase